MGKQRQRKVKQKGRFARFSGSTTKIAIRIRERLLHDGDLDEKGRKVKLTEEEVRLKRVEVYVGPKSLSKQVINTGRGPDPQRMQQYYDAVPTAASKAITLAEDLGIKDKRYATVWWETPKTNKLSLIETRVGRLDLFYSQTGWFFVDLNYKQKIIKRSCVYRDKVTAMNRLELNRIAWVEQIPMES